MRRQQLQNDIQSQEIACGRTSVQEICFHTNGQLMLPGNFGPYAAVAQPIWWVCASGHRRNICYAAKEDRSLLTTIWSDSWLYFLGCGGPC